MVACLDHDVVQLAWHSGALARLGTADEPALTVARAGQNLGRPS